MREDDEKQRDTPNPGDRSGDGEAHHSLSNPAGEPDETEYPDPYEQREDPAEPPEELTFGDEDPHRPTGSESTSDPHPSQDPEAPDWEGPKRDHIDD